jgi:hypothetical protein
MLDNTIGETWSEDRMASVDPVGKETSSQHVARNVTRVKQVLNVNAPEFNMSPNKMQKIVDTREITTQTDSRVEHMAKGSQTAFVTPMVTVGTQCDVEKRSVGIKCNILPTHKSKFVQATAPVKSQGVGATVKIQASATQCVKIGDQILKKDAAIWCKQSPGSIGRHVQTMEKITVEVKTNTDPIVTHTVGMETDMVTSEWSEIVVQEYGADVLSKSWKYGTTCDSDGPFTDRSPSSHCGGQSDIPVCEGKPGLSELLKTKGVLCSSVDQYPDFINNCQRNRKIKGIIQAIQQNRKGQAGEEGKHEYWVTLDDVMVSVTQIATDFVTGRYIKLYGEYESLMSRGEDLMEYIWVKNNSEVFKKCEAAVMEVVDSILSQIRSRHKPWEYGRGYNRDSRHESDYGGYRGDGGGEYGNTSRNINFYRD